MPEHYRVLDKVILSPEIEAKVKLLADAFHAATLRDIVVTSGLRSAHSQAVAMYDKLAGGDDLAIYRQQDAAQAIRQRYTDGLQQHQSRDTIVARMEAEIEQQISMGIYLSAHLRNGAVDIRSRDMTDSEKQAFMAIAEQMAESVILEAIPPHFHVQL